MSKTITTLEIGNEQILDRKTKLIRFEGTNEDFFWRIYGDVINPNCVIVVPPTHQAIFIKDGMLQDVLSNGTHKVFERGSHGFLGIGKKKDAAVVDIIFLNKTIKFNCFWGTKNPIYKIDTSTKVPVSLRGNGEFEVTIDNPKKFYLEIVGTDKRFNIDSLRERLSNRLLAKIEEVISDVMSDNEISYLEISQNKKILSNAILPFVDKMFREDCGLKVHSFTIAYLQIDNNERKKIESKLENQRSVSYETEDDYPEDEEE